MIKNIIISILLLLPFAGAANLQEDSQPLPEKPSGTAFIVISKRDLTLTVYDLVTPPWLHSSLAAWARTRAIN